MNHVGLIHCSLRRKLKMLNFGEPLKIKPPNCNNIQYKIRFTCQITFYFLTSLLLSFLPPFLTYLQRAHIFFLQHISVPGAAADHFAKTSRLQQRRLPPRPDKHPVSSPAAHPARLGRPGSRLLQLLQQYTNTGQHATR